VSPALGGYFFVTKLAAGTKLAEPDCILAGISAACVVSDRDQLLQINRQVAEGMLRVVQQERRLAALERSAYPTSDARAILAAFKQTLQQMMDRRKAMLLSLGEPLSGCMTPTAPRLGKARLW
jgi:hypothetical protein